MRVIATKLEGVKIIVPSVFKDTRGYFMESYNKKRFQENSVKVDFIQDNHSFSEEAGTIRGLHYQLNPMAQTKLIRVVFGSIYDVVVDVRRNSPTYGQWEGFHLSADNNHQLLVPKGFAHGFCTLVPQTHVMYKVDNYYSPEHDCGIIWNDSTLSIDWPTTSPILSEKDTKLKSFLEAENNFEE